MVRTGLALVLVLAVVDGVFGERGLLNNVPLRQRNANRQVAIDELSRANETLTEDIRRLREDPSAIEELARGQLGLIRDGELLIIMRDIRRRRRPRAMRGRFTDEPHTAALTVRVSRGTLHKLFRERLPLLYTL